MMLYSTSFLYYTDYTVKTVRQAKMGRTNSRKMNLQMDSLSQEASLSFVSSVQANLETEKRQVLGENDFYLLE